MNKIFLSLFFFLFFIVSNAATDSTTIDFLKKLNQNYYCLTSEGLRDFQCQIKSSLFESYKSAWLTKYGPEDKRSQSIEKVEFQFGFPAAEGFSFEPINYSPSGNVKFDTQTAEVFKHVELILKENLFPWALFTLQPVFDEEALKNRDFKIQKSNGNTFVISSGDEPVTEIFDKQSGICFEAGEKATIKSTKSKFITNPKGFLLSESEADFPNGAKMSLRMESQSIEGFLMPKRLLVQVENIGASHQQNADSAFLFTDYKINQNPDKK